MAERQSEVAWTPGMKHPTFNVVAAEEEGTWRPAPGYKWTDNPPRIERVSWTPGLKHPEKNLVAGEEEGSWVPAPGYAWTE